jgi:hypothetical protein
MFMWGTKDKLLRTKASIWYNKLCKAKQLPLGMFTWTSKITIQGTLLFDIELVWRDVHFAVSAQEDTQF